MITKKSRLDGARFSLKNSKHFSTKIGINHHGQIFFLIKFCLSIVLLGLRPKYSVAAFQALKDVLFLVKFQYNPSYFDRGSFNRIFLLNKNFGLIFSIKSVSLLIEVYWFTESDTSIRFVYTTKNRNKMNGAFQDQMSIRTWKLGHSKEK